MQVTGLPRGEDEAYVRSMITWVVGLAKIVLILLLTMFAVAFVVGVARPETGVVEKVALLALVAGCVVLAAKLSSLATKSRNRLQRH